MKNLSLFLLAGYFDGSRSVGLHYEKHYELTTLLKHLISPLFARAKTLHYENVNVLKCFALLCSLRSSRLCTGDSLVNASTLIYTRNKVKESVKADLVPIEVGT